MLPVFHKIVFDLQKVNNNFKGYFASVGHTYNFQGDWYLFVEIETNDNSKSYIYTHIKSSGAISEKFPDDRLLLM